MVQIYLRNVLRPSSVFIRVNDILGQCLKLEKFNITVKDVRIQYEGDCLKSHGKVPTERNMRILAFKLLLS